MFSYPCRLEQRLATRRARLAELRQQMEKEREDQPQKDPEAMQTLTRVQVRRLFVTVSGDFSPGLPENIQSTVN